MCPPARRMAGMLLVAFVGACAPLERRLDEARALQRAGDPDAALAVYDELLAAARERRDLGLEGRALRGSAEILYGSRGELEAARERLGRALSLARSASDLQLEADTLASLGVYHWWYERQRDRVLADFWMPARERYEELGDRRGLATVRSYLGLVHLAAAEYESAADEFEASRGLYEELGDEDGLGSVHAYLGALWVGLENLPQAYEHYRTSLEIAEKSGDADGVSRLRPLLADLDLRRGDAESAADAFEVLLAGAPDPSVARRNHLLSRGLALMHLERFTEASASFESALDVQARLPGVDEPFRSRALSLLANAHLQAGELDAAAAALIEAEAIPLRIKGWGEAVTTLLARADLADRRGEAQAALSHIAHAAEIESRTFSRAASHVGPSQYHQIFERLVAVLFHRDAALREPAQALAFRILEQMRYRSFRSVLVRLADAPATRPPGAAELDAVERIDRLTRQLEGRFTAETRETLRRAYAEYEDRVLAAELTASRYRLAAATRPIELATLQASLDPRTVLVEYVMSELVEEHTFALVVTAEDVVSVELPASPSDLEARVKLLRQRIFERGGDGWRPLADELGRLLVVPLEASGSLDAADRLILVPMGFLHDLPFAALGTSTGERLVERWILSLAPSATLWARRRTASLGRGTLAFGLRQSGTAELAELAWAEKEARAVAAAVAGEVRLGVDATETAFKSLTPSFRRIHVATHGQLEPRVPLHSRLRLEPDEPAQDGALTVREILDLDLSAELVSLSACETALSQATGLEADRIGFVEAFLYAGAENVVASLLPISDGASAAFMTSFYEGLRLLSPAEALAATQRRMLSGTITLDESAGAGEASDLRHPRYWAPFVLVGK